MVAVGWLDHKALRIIKGVPKTPTDNNSPEQDLVIADLMSGIITLDKDGWSPQIPQIKNGGVWTDSPISDGRQLLAGAASNVIEKMSVNITDNSYLGMIKAYSNLKQLADDCRNYWQSLQIDPIYLMWEASCGKGSQYALLFNIDLSPTYEDATQPTLKVDMTLEREPYWRGIPPGANPKLWTFYVNPTQPTTSNVDLLTRTDDLVYDTAVYNKHEWNPTDYLIPLSKNYVDIPASKIPGDAPALVELIVKAPNNNPGGVSLTARNIYFWRSTRPTTMVDRDASLYGQTDIINACDCNTSLATVTVDATNGVISNGSAITKNILTYTVAISATVQDLFTSSGAGRGIPPINLERGQISVFLRCKQTNGALGDVQVRTRFTNGVAVSDPSSITFFTGDYANIPILNANYPFGLLYLGTFTLPVANRAAVSADGRGLFVPRKVSTGAPPPNSARDLLFTFDVKNNVAATRNLQFLDFILMHSDEALIALNQPTFNASKYAVLPSYLYDNTGYFSHGQIEPFGATGLTEVAPFVANNYPEIAGDNLTLEPNVNNRLYFLSTFASATSNPTDVESGVEGNLNYEIRLNIVPRWAGIRDV